MKTTHALLLLAAVAASAMSSARLEARAGDVPAGQAPHAPLPILGSEGGPVLATSKVVPIYYAADPLASDLSGYFAKLATSGYLARAVAGYGVRSLTIAPPVALADPVPPAVADTDIATWLVSEIASGALPAAGASTVYQIVYPAATEVSASSYGGASYPTCSPFNEEAYPASGVPIPFGVVPLCEGFLPSMTDLESDTYGSTGNVASTVTNPYPYDAPAFGEPSWSGSGWSLFTGTQAGTLCSGLLTERTTTPLDLGYLAATIWSNQAARAGRNPCPDYSGAREAYFNAAPDIEGGTNINQFLVAKGLVLPVTGGSVTVPVRLFSDGPTGEWSISASERLDLDGQPAPVLTFAFDRTTGRNGDVRYLTITRAAAAAGSLFPTEVVPLLFEITSTKGAASHGWIAVVGNE
jgi:hypothetical protein